MNLPNKITLARGLLLPVMWFAAWLGKVRLLILLVLINEAGDIIDGYVARKLKQETTFGATFDAVVDILVYISIALWAVMFFPQLITNNIVTVAIILIIATVPIFISLTRFRKVLVFHLISSKMLAVAIIVSFVISLLFNQAINLLAVILFIMIILNSIERCLIIIIAKKEIPQNLKSVFKLKK